jgi:PTH1 family peptidyl-tRNA hydrolase
LKYLIAGLGNIGNEYAQTRHNIGFNVLDALAKASNICFEDNRYANMAELKFKGRTLVLIKPTTYMNLSGRAVNYWMQKERITAENVLIIVDDLAIPFGSLRLRPKGSDGGHNGLKNISEVLGHSNYARLRFGIGDNFHKGQQVDYVLSKWTREEETELIPRIEMAGEIIKTFVTIGLERTMSAYNNK